MSNYKYCSCFSESALWIQRFGNNMTFFGKFADTFIGCQKSLFIDVILQDKCKSFPFSGRWNKVQRMAEVKHKILDYGIFS